MIINSLTHLESMVTESHHSPLKCVIDSILVSCAFLFFSDTLSDTINLENLTLSSTPLAVLIGNIKLVIDDKMNRYPFRPASLSDCGGKLSARWRIVFGVYDVQRQKIVKRYDYKINQFKTAQERNTYYIMRKEHIDETLAKGYVIDKSSLAQPGDLVRTPKKDYMSIVDAYEWALNTKVVRRGSYLCYKSTSSKFTDWCRQSGIQKISINTLDKERIQDYLDTQYRRGLSGTTINNNIAHMKAMHNFLVKRGKAVDNPWLGIEKYKEEKSIANTAYLEHEKRELIGLIKENTALHMFVELMYHTFARPSEIHRLKKSFINLTDRKILIPANISKNAKSDYVVITNALYPILKEYVKNCEGVYLFPGVGGKKHMGKNQAAERWHKPFLKALELDGARTFYSWKHTGVCDAYRAGIPIKWIQLQCRHHSIQQTDHYLKSMGMYENVEMKELMPEL